MNSPDYPGLPDYLPRHTLFARLSVSIPFPGKKTFSASLRFKSLPAKERGREQMSKVREIFIFKSRIVFAHRGVSDLCSGIVYIEIVQNSKSWLFLSAKIDNVFFRQ